MEKQDFRRRLNNPGTCDILHPSCQQSSHLVINRVDHQPQRDFDLAFVHIYQEFKVCVAMVILQSKYGNTCLYLFVSMAPVARL